MSVMENVPYGEIEIVQTAHYERVASEQNIKLFAAASGDVNPVHLDAEYAATTRFGERIAHGMFTAGLISAALAMQLPGPGVIYLGQNLKFERPVKLGDTVTVELEVLKKRDDKRILVLQTTGRNQHGKTVVSGTATVIAAAEKISIKRPDEPDVTVNF